MSKRMKRIFSLVITLTVFSAVACLTAYASLTQLTQRIDATHDGTEGYAFSSLTAVNSTLYNSTRFYYTSSVSNKPTPVSSLPERNVYVTGKLYKNSSMYDSVFTHEQTHVGNNTSTGTVITTIKSGYRSYDIVNDMFKTYIKIELCPPAYQYYSSFKFGGVFYGVS